MKKIKSFNLFENKQTLEDEAKELNDIVEPSLFGLIEDYDPVIDSRLKDDRFFIVQFMFAKRNKRKRELTFDDTRDFIEDTEYLLGAYKHIYKVMRKLVIAGYECILNHDNDGNSDGSPGPYYISLHIPRKGHSDTSELDWMSTSNKVLILSKNKLNDWLGEFSQALEDISYEEEEDNIIQLKIEIGGIGLGGETMTARQILKMEKMLKTNKKIVDINIQDTRIFLDFQLADDESFNIKP